MDRNHISPSVEARRNNIPRFRSILWAGFECTYALTENGTRLDMLAATRHDHFCRQDYQLAQSVGIYTVREGLAWSQIDKGNGCYDFSRFAALMAIGHEEGIQQVWDLNHFDYPNDCDLFSEEFVLRFTAYAVAAHACLRRYIQDTLYIVPINEISFFSWIGADRGVWAPYTKGQKRGLMMKQQLVRAALAAMRAIWERDPDVRFIHVDPFMRRKATSPISPTARRHVRAFNRKIRFEAWDMLAGYAYPELGGHPRYLDMIGVNYYIHNQEWVHSLSVSSSELRHERMEWESEDRVPLATMLLEITQRYHRPIIVTETGSYGTHRPAWWNRMIREYEEAVRLQLPVYGICAYPFLDRPGSVDYLERCSGLVDFACDDPTCMRIPHQESITAITASQTLRLKRLPEG